jgi:hypothetical protein
MVLIDDRERDASSRENFPRACSLLLPASLQIDFVFKALQENHGRCALGRLSTLKEKTMRKSVKRMTLAMVLMVAGSAMQVHATTLPAPVPPLPPIACN